MENSEQTELEQPNRARVERLTREAIGHAKMRQWADGLARFFTVMALFIFVAVSVFAIV